MKDLEIAVHNLFLDLLSQPGAIAWWAEAKPKGKFMPNTVATIEKMQQLGRQPIGPHL